VKPTIRNKLVGGFCGVLALMALVAGIGGYSVYNLKQGAYDATRVGGQLNSSAIEIQAHNLEADRRIKSYLTEVKEKGVEKANAGFVEEADFEIHEIQSLAAKAVALAPTAEMRTKFTSIADASKAFQVAVAAVVDATKKDPGGERMAAAISAYEGAAETLHESAEDGELAGADASQASLENIDRISSQSVLWVSGISFAGLVLGIVTSYKLARAILVPVEHLKEVAENVSLGNLEIAVRRYSEDEIGDLADSFSRMVTAVRFFRMEAELSQAEAVEGSAK
jgi:methyl-accepting chemotaxis protein